MSAKPTLDDVAAVAGVSAKTVSNVLLDRPHVAAATRERVHAAVKTVGYQVNRAGRGLASGRSGRIAVVVPNLYQPYFAEIAERLILALAAAGFTSTLRVALDARAERDAVRGATTADADGVIICPHHLSADLLGARTPDRPVVQVGGGPTGLVDVVVMGERDGFEAVTRHLLDSGRRRLALVWNATASGRPEGSRYEGFVAAHRSRGLEPDPGLMVAGSDWDRRVSGYEAMTGLLRTGAQFDAVVGINDAVAVGAMRALRSHGLRVPEDVAVTGFDDTDEAGFTVPPLTSVSPEQELMVTAAVQMLMERLDGLDSAAREHRTGAHLVPRASSGAARSRV
ncbi:LacI family DNA-binding transcriptional regulator [Ruania halotolerans]|uniref:LacI family DNA-binding transcriptional regulator n=1 Tax=Ruania halotolerans TaxID=2897773 RepID=UPI001E56900F|nr:LacI family DNA-binding transcriptional regulator [Ruania halotolerans]UFU06654.1 LacI family transcriptional regulator [Ruania halotolerans]